MTIEKEELRAISALTSKLLPQENNFILITWGGSTDIPQFATDYSLTLDVANKLKALLQEINAEQKK